HAQAPPETAATGGTSTCTLLNPTSLNCRAAGVDPARSTIVRTTPSTTVTSPALNTTVPPVGTDMPVREYLVPDRSTVCAVSKERIVSRNPCTRSAGTTRLVKRPGSSDCDS